MTLTGNHTDSEQINSVPSRLEDLVISHPPSSDVDKRKTLLFVAEVNPSTEIVRNALLAQGYSVSQFPSISTSRDYLDVAYIDAVFIDVDGRLAESREDYRQGEGEVYRFVKDVTDSIDRDLTVFLVAAQNPNRMFTPPVSDLVNIGARASTGELGLRPYDSSQLLQPEFFAQLDSVMANRARNQRSRISSIGTSLPAPPNSDELPFDVGQEAAYLYTKDPTGGFSFVEGTITIGGVFAPLDPNKQYTPEAKTFHIKNVSRREATGFANTYAFLMSQDPELKTPAPLGYHVLGDDAFAIRTFEIAAAYSDLADLLSPHSPNKDPEAPEFDARIWKTILDVLYETKFAEWYKLTHDRVMEDDHSLARENVVAGQINHMLLLPSELGRITGYNFSGDELQQNRQDVDQIFKNYRPNPKLYVLPWDPKGANIGLETFKSRPDAESLRVRYGGNDQTVVDRIRLERDFAFWDYKLLGAVNPILTDVFQAVLDPDMLIPETDKPVHVFTVLDSIVPRDDPRKFFDDVLVQGIAKSMLKAYVTAAHAQVNEYREAISKTRDFDVYTANQAKLQSQFEYFVGQTLKHLSVANRAWREDWAKLPLEQGIDKMQEHFTDRAQWYSLENGHGVSHTHLAHIRRMHCLISKFKDEEHLKFDTDKMRRDALTGNFLRY